MRSEREKEYILHRGMSVVADYFRNRVMDAFQQGKVAVLVKTFVEGLYFIPCDEWGYPQVTQLKFVEFPPLTAWGMTKDGEVPTQNISVTEYTIWVKRPLVLCDVPDFEVWNRRPQVFLWEAEIMDTKKIPIEKLNVQELMLLAQTAIKNREGIILNVAMDNKPIK
jgi:hypothetical protein